jgi:hypothetical protein
VIVAFQPGGTVRDVRVVLKPEEKVPNKFNTKEAIIYREDPENPREWILVKPKFSVLAEDSELLSQPALPEVNMGTVIPIDGEALYEHVDIIRFESTSEDNSGSGIVVPNPPDNLDS